MSATEENKPQSVNPLELSAEDLLKQDSMGQWTAIWREVLQSRPPLFACIILVLLGLLAVFAPLIANHRPYVAVLVEDGVSSISFPLFKNLGAIDWTLLALVFFLGWILLWRKSIRRAGGKGNRLVLSLFLLCALVPIPWSLLLTPWGKPLMPDSVLFWVGYSLVSFVGVVVLVRGARLLYVGAVDALGTDLSGSALSSLLIGALLIIFGIGQFGTLSRPKLDTTDYYKKFVTNAAEGTWGIFAPMTHNYTNQESYLRNQRPMGPHVHVIGSGGSDAAADLHLTKNTKGKPLQSALVNDQPLTAATLLSDLRKGEGIRQHDRKKNDLIVVTGDLSRTNVKLFGAKTVGDVVELMNAAASKKDFRSGEIKPAVYKAELQEGLGIKITDLSVRRPTHYMGTDDNGSDVAARLVHASRVAASIGFVSTSIAIIIGVSFGAVIGYFGGWVDAIGMRIIEIFMAIPRFFLLITIIAIIPPEMNQYMLYLMMVVIGLTSWMGSARFIRAEFFRLREVDYIQAAKACGLPLRSILFRHMLPNGITPVLVNASFGVAAAIFLETGLSFLGFGIKPPEPSWGQMLSRAVDRSTGVFYWWLAIFPGIMIFLTVFSFNILGDALRDAFDPKLKKASAL